MDSGCTRKRRDKNTVQGRTRCPRTGGTSRPISTGLSPAPQDVHGSASRITTGERTGTQASYLMRRFASQLLQCRESDGRFACVLGATPWILSRRTLNLGFPKPRSSQRTDRKGPKRRRPRPGYISSSFDHLYIYLILTDSFPVGEHRIRGVPPSKAVGSKALEQVRECAMRNRPPVYGTPESTLPLSSRLQPCMCPSKFVYWSNAKA